MYENKWIGFSAKHRKDLIMITRQSQKSFTFRSGLIKASLRTFTKVKNINSENSNT